LNASLIGRATVAADGTGVERLILILTSLKGTGLDAIVVECCFIKYVRKEYCKADEWLLIENARAEMDA
jgi:hypothetical protein